jgi:hypothetical protein
MVSYRISFHERRNEIYVNIDDLSYIALNIQHNNLGEYYFWNRNQTFLKVNFKLK